MPFPAFFLLTAALGAREGIANRRDRNALIDIEAERQDTINNIDLGINTQGVSNQFDARQIEVMQRQFQTAQGLLGSSDPKMQAIGANMIQDLDTAVRGNIQQNENEARADAVRIQDQEILATGIGKANNEKRFERELKMNQQLRKELAPVREAEVGYQKIMNALENGDVTGTQIALTAMIQSIDGSVVRGEELRNYTSTNGAINFFVNALNKLEGKDFTKETKISIANGGAALINAERARGMSLAESFQTRALSFGLDPKRVLAGVDTNLFTPAPINREAQLALEERADQAEAEMRNQPFEEIEPSLRSQAISPLIEGAQILTQQVRRNLSGVKLLRNAKGELFEQAPDGTLKAVGRDDRFQTDSGRNLRLVDKGNGRFEWVEDEAATRQTQREPGLFQEGGFFDRRNQ